MLATVESIQGDEDADEMVKESSKMDEKMFEENRARKQRFEEISHALTAQSGVKAGVLLCAIPASTS